jgi:hypothetical protein
MRATCYDGPVRSWPDCVQLAWLLLLTPKWSSSLLSASIRSSWSWNDLLALEAIPMARGWLHDGGYKGVDTSPVVMIHSPYLGSVKTSGSLSTSFPRLLTEKPRHGHHHRMFGPIARTSILGQRLLLCCHVCASRRASRLCRVFTA